MQVLIEKIYYFFSSFFFHLIKLLNIFATDKSCLKRKFISKFGAESSQLILPIRPLLQTLFTLIKIFKLNNGNQKLYNHQA